MTAAGADLVTVDAMADEFGISAVTRNEWRRTGKGPRPFRVGRRIVYRRSEVEAWVAQREDAQS